ncbi:unnamed protein product [Calypogeia fissa]
MAFHECKSRRMSRLVFLFLRLLLAVRFFSSVCFCRVDDQPRSFVLELTQDTLPQAIEKYDVIMVEFFAPWCSHCQRLAPEYERAAQILYKDAPNVKLAKIDADKYNSIAKQYDIDGFPTLRLYTNGIPTEASYEGSRSAETIVAYVKRSIVPPVTNLSTESDLTDFVKSVNDDSPIFVGFGLEPSKLEDLARKHKRKAWFAVIQDVSEKMMQDYDFDKRPAVVGMHPNVGEQIVFYGPFEGSDLGDYILQHLMPSVSSVDNPEIVQRLKDDGRPIAIGVVGSKSDSSSVSFIQKLKMAAPANRAFVFAYVETTKALAFVEPFGIGKASSLPTVVIWDGESHFSKSDDLEAFVGADAEAQLTKFLQDFRDGKLKLRALLSPPFLQLARKILFGGPTLFLVCVLIVVVVLLQGCKWNAFTGDGDYGDEHRDRTRRADLEGDVIADRIPGDSVDPLYFARKSEKRD